MLRCARYAGASFPPMLCGTDEPSILLLHNLKFYDIYSVWPWTVKRPAHFIMCQYWRACVCVSAVNTGMPCPLTYFRCFSRACSFRHSVCVYDTLLCTYSISPVVSIHIRFGPHSAKISLRMIFRIFYFMFSLHRYKPFIKQSIKWI